MTVVPDMALGLDNGVKAAYPYPSRRLKTVFETNIEAIALADTNVLPQGRPEP